MRFNWLGRTGVRVPELALGLGTQVGTADFDAKVSLSLDAGVCLIDTADAYSDGKSEELLGEVLVGRRNRVLLSTTKHQRSEATGPAESAAVVGDRSGTELKPLGWSIRRAVREAWERSSQLAR